MYQLISRRLAAFILCGAVGTGAALAAEVTQGTDASDDSIETSPGETRPGRVPNCNPTASNCERNTDHIAPDVVAPGPFNGANTQANPEPPATGAANPRRQDNDAARNDRRPTQAPRARGDSAPVPSGAASSRGGNTSNVGGGTGSAVGGSSGGGR